MKKTRCGNKAARSLSLFKTVNDDGEVKNYGTSRHFLNGSEKLAHRHPKK